MEDKSEKNQNFLPKIQTIKCQNFLSSNLFIRDFIKPEPFPIQDYPIKLEPYPNRHYPNRPDYKIIRTSNNSDIPD